MSDITINRMEYPENVRRNVTMYLGSTDNYSVSAREVRDNSLDEMLGGHCDRISITAIDDYNLVLDNGRGIPVYADERDASVSILESAITDLHAGSKTGHSTDITTGLHGLGSSVVNAVSAEFTVIRRIMEKDIGKLHTNVKVNDLFVLSYNKGVKAYEKVLSSVDELAALLDERAFDTIKAYGEFSTAVFFKADMDIYQSASVEIDTIPMQIMLRDNPQNSIEINGAEVAPFDFVAEVANSEPLFLEQTVKFEYVINPYMRFSGELAYHNVHMHQGYPMTLFNLLNTSDGGIMSVMLYTCFGRALSHFDNRITPGEARWGMLMMGNFLASYRPGFGSQTKTKLTNLGMNRGDWNNHHSKVSSELAAAGKSDSEIDEALAADYERLCYNANSVYDDTTRFFASLIKNNREYFSAVCEKIHQFKLVSKKMSNREYVQSKLVMGDDYRKRASNSAEAAKVYEATNWDAATRELYITEGKSASNGLIKMRDTSRQAVLPLRGKLKNSTMMDVEDLVENSELLGMINTIGAGAGELFNLEHCRYMGGIIITTDADEDGLHIRNLVTTVFLTHAPEIIENGLLYYLDTPFYRVGTGRKTAYYYKGEEDQFDIQSDTVVKLKGLGSLTDAESSRFLLSDERRLYRITMPEDSGSLEQAVKLLYSPRARRQLLEDLGVFAE